MCINVSKNPVLKNVLITQKKIQGALKKLIAQLLYGQAIIAVETIGYIYCQTSSHPPRQGSCKLDELKTEDKLKYEVKPKNEDDLKNEDEPKNEDDLKNEGKPKNEENLKMKMAQK